jgi:hypothetical protein
VTRAFAGTTLILLGLLPLPLAVLLVACGSSSQSVASAIGGNSYLTDPAYAPNPTNPISGVGLALVDTKGSLSGNVTTYLVGDQPSCVSLAFDLPATGRIDETNHLALTATDGIVSFDLTATVNGANNSFPNAHYTVSGAEAYPTASTRAYAGLLEQPQSSAAPSSCTGTLKGQLFPALGSYSGTLTASNGTQVDAAITLEQSTIPYAGSSAPAAAIITQGREYMYASGFAVNGAISLKNSVCGVTSASIQPREGYLLGNYLVVEFDTDTTYKTGASLAFSIDPTSGALTLVPGIFIQEYNANCFVPYIAGNLTRQLSAL